MKKILFKYLFKEILSPFLTSLLVLTSILLLGSMAPMTELLLRGGTSFWDMFQMVLFSLPHLLLFAFPMATLFGTLLGYTRMAKDREILALKASGVSFYQMLPAAAFLSLSIYLLALFTGIYAQPWGNYASKVLVFRMMQLRADLGVREGGFSDALKGFVIYVQNVSKKDGRLEHVYVSDERDQKNSSTIVAKEGWIISQPERLALLFYLRNGSIHSLGRDRTSAQTINFDEYVITLSSALDAAHQLKKEKSEMSINEIREKIKTGTLSSAEYCSLVVEMHRKLALPVACLILGLVGASLGAQARFAGTSFGIPIGLIVFLLYYVVMAFGKGLGEAGKIYPEIGMWIPNAIFAILAIYLVIKTNGEEPIWPMEALQRLSDLMERVRNKLAKDKNGKRS